MSWPHKCASCGSKDVQATVHELHCLKCGRLTGKDGHVVPLDEQNLSADAYRDQLLEELAALKAVKAEEEK